MKRSSIGFCRASAAGSGGGHGELTMPPVVDWTTAFETVTHCQIAGARPTNRAAITIGQRRCMVLLIFGIMANFSADYAQNLEKKTANRVRPPEN